EMLSSELELLLVWPSTVLILVTVLNPILAIRVSSTRITNTHPRSINHDASCPRRNINLKSVRITTTAREILTTISNRKTQTTRHVGRHARPPEHELFTFRLRQFPLRRNHGVSDRRRRLRHVHLSQHAMRVTNIRRLSHALNERIRSRLLIGRLWPTELRVLDTENNVPRLRARRIRCRNIHQSFRRITPRIRLPRTTLVR